MDQIRDLLGGALRPSIDAEITRIIRVAVVETLPYIAGALLITAYLVPKRTP